MTVPRIPDILASLLGTDINKQNKTNKQTNQNNKWHLLGSSATLAAYPNLLRRLSKTPRPSPTSYLVNPPLWGHSSGIRAVKMRLRTTALEKQTGIKCLPLAVLDPVLRAVLKAAPMQCYHL